MEQPRSEVTVVDIKMPFISMVVFMVKWAVAAIPGVVDSLRTRIPGVRRPVFCVRDASPINMSR